MRRRPLEPDPGNAGVGKNMSKATSETKIIAKERVIIDLTVILKDVLPSIYHLPQGGICKRSRYGAVVLECARGMEGVLFR